GGAFGDRRFEVVAHAHGQGVEGEVQVGHQLAQAGEGSKSGCAPEDLPALAKAVAGLPNLRLRGLMAIPEPTD
ncbi:hypothetical protein R0G64_31330, partial [Pseudomonas otitidis]|nr:hypothetical protein [Pseudomonas otitidis]